MELGQVVVTLYTRELERNITFIKSYNLWLTDC